MLSKIAYRQSIKNIKNYIGKTGDKTPHWQGGIRIDERGYVRVWTGNKQWKYQHRMIIEKSLGRELNFNETIHHKDGNKANNSIDNLEILARSLHTKIHQKYAKTGKEIPCLQCNKPVYREPCKLNTGRKTFCGKNCLNIYKRINHCN